MSSMKCVALLAGTYVSLIALTATGPSLAGQREPVTGSASLTDQPVQLAQSPPSENEDAAADEKGETDDGKPKRKRPNDKDKDGAQPEKGSEPDGKDNAPQDNASEPKAKNDARPGKASEPEAKDSTRPERKGDGEPMPGEDAPVTNEPSVKQKPAIPAEKASPKLETKPEPKVVPVQPVPAAKDLPKAAPPPVVTQPPAPPAKPIPPEPKASPAAPALPATPAAPPVAPAAAPDEKPVPATPSAPQPRDKSDANTPASKPAPAFPTTSPPPAAVEKATPGSPTPAGSAESAAPPSKKLDEVKLGRKETVEDGGKRTIIREPDNRVIIRQDNRVFIQHNENSRFDRLQKGSRKERRSDGTDVTILDRPGGVQIYSVADADGRLIRRYRRDREGREFDIIDNRRRDNLGRKIAIGVGVGIGIGVGAAIISSIIDRPPPRITIPREKYIVEYERASEDDVYEAFSAPPVERLERAYSLDEVRYSRPLRQYMRRIDLNDINFEFGSWEVADAQIKDLERAARAMLRVIERNPDEVFLIEGHTDKVGTDIDNLTLSDRRAEAVAILLTESFDVPPENLTTQGYGEQFPKVETSGPEVINRRVAVRRITPLLTHESGG